MRRRISQSQHHCSIVGQGEAARDVGDCMTHSPERRKEKAKGEGETASYALVSMSGTLEVCNNGIAVVSGK